MALEKIKSVMGKAVLVAGDDIDTDRIIPARFMKCVTFEGLGQYSFYDVRFDQDNKSLNHVLDQPENRFANILISGANFGCGSSREHAPQALFYFGFRAIIAQSFAEIFFCNCTTLGIPCISLSKDNINLLVKTLKENNSEIKINLENKLIETKDLTIQFEMPEQALKSLIDGKWDSLADLLDNMPQVKELEKQLV